MIRVPNYLRLYRKKSPLTQSDIAFLLQLPDYSNISRYEKGHRVPNIDLLIAYHYLFKTPIESFFELQSNEMLISLNQRIDLLIKELKESSTAIHNNNRIKFLEEVLISLNN
jgi:transcriptional regulator with XRE-family HTH domain